MPTFSLLSEAHGTAHEVAFSNTRDLLQRARLESGTAGRPPDF